MGLDSKATCYSNTGRRRSRYDYAAQELAVHRARIEEEVLSTIRDRIQNIESVKDVPDKPASRQTHTPDTLALVGEDEFEDWLNLSAVIKQIEENTAAPLYTFEQRYSRLLGMPISRKNNPFGPESMGRAFQRAIQVLDFTNALRAVVYKAWGQAISSRSADLYAQLNQTLAQLQPVKHKTAESPRSPQDTRHPGSSPDTSDEAQTRLSGERATPPSEWSDTLGGLLNPTQSGSQTGAAGEEYSLDRILSNLSQLQRRGGAEPISNMAVGRMPTDADSISGQQMEQATFLSVVRQLQQSVQHLSNKDALATAAIREPAVATDTHPPDASLNELKRVLDKLPLVSPAGQDKQSIVTLSDQIDAHILSEKGEVRRLALPHRRILDATSELFARARADIVPSSDIEALVKRLERPLLKLALQDPHFPDKSDHPARQVVNLIEQFAVAADDGGKFFDAKLQRFLFLLVDRICNRADEDPGIYETVRDNLEKVLPPILQIRRTRIARMQEACEGRERIRSARLNVNHALEQKLAGREVPAMVLRLLDAGWRQYLVLLEMRQGGQGEAWVNALAVLDRLFTWLAPDETLSVSRSAATAATLLSDIEHGLRTVNVDSNLLGVFVGELSACLTVETPQSSAPSSTVRVPPGRLSRSAAGVAELSIPHRQLASRLRVGDWWDLQVEDQRVPMQLIWNSQSDLTHAFSNRSATSKLEFTLADLSRQIQRGLAKPGRDLDLPVIERSENTLFDETYQDLMQQVLSDPITGLLNRKGFLQRLSLLGMPVQDDKTHAVGIIEFDQFRMIYNTCGVDAVETLARKLAHEAQSKIGNEAVLASFRDDTLAILLPNCNRAIGCEAIDLLLSQMKDYRFQHEQHSYSIGFNIGVAEFLPTHMSVTDAIRRADSACITAKAQGRNRMQIYEATSPQLQTQESLMVWAGRIDSFLNGQGLHLRCQQVMPLGVDDTSLPYYEILLGIEDENGDEINPMHFIPAVERLQRAHEIDIWVIRNVFAWIASHRDKFDALGGFAINLSATSLSSPEVIEFLKEVLPASDFPTRKITFEITETAAIGSYGAAQDFIRDIRRYGCKFALDDFGSGFTSYSHLKNLRTDSLKIDGSFVKDMLNNPGDYAMVKSMNDIAHSLGLKTVAEYVESPMILHALREIGVDFAQGYAVHKPCPIDDILIGE
ncbi:MAG TPA: DUF1631 family protein [Thiobacillus sp.]